MLNFLRNSLNGDWFFAHLPRARTCQTRAPVKNVNKIVVCNTASKTYKMATAVKKRRIGPGQSKKLLLINIIIEHGDMLSMKLCPGLTNAKKIVVGNPWLVGYHWHCFWVSFVKWKSCLVIYFCLSVGSSLVTFSKDLRKNNVLSRL